MLNSIVRNIYKIWVSKLYFVAMLILQQVPMNLWVNANYVEEIDKNIFRTIDTM